LLIEALLDRAGYTVNDKAKVLGGNIAELMAIDIAAACKAAPEANAVLCGPH